MAARSDKIRSCAKQGAILLAALVLFAGAGAGQEFRYSLGVGAGPVGLTGGSGYKFNKPIFFNASIGNKLSDRWAFFIDADFGKLSSSVYPYATAADSAVDLKGLRMVGTLNYRLFSSGRAVHLYLGAGGGFLNWNMLSPRGDTTYKVQGVRSPSIDFKASELLGTALVRLMIQPSRSTSINLTVSADYLTNAGAEFDKSVNDKRDRWMYGSALSFNVLLGGGVSKEKWRSDLAWKDKTGNGPGKPLTSALDSDGDGVPDEFDKCPNTPRGAVVDATGCPLDSDRDGVPDGLDDCPNTPPEARGFVDVHGCPVDEDFDGVPDYLDACPHTPIGALVDSVGCPVDSDGDGVPDGLDDCPHTLKGIPVDKYGCTDVTIFGKPMVLYIDYDPGGFEVDPRNKTKLEQLARILKIVPDYKLEINAYTDDIGTEEANQKLSEKRANRVKEYLVIDGVPSDRIKTVGRGETDFSASNQTAEGRAKNRRIEILFYK